MKPLSFPLLRRAAIAALVAVAVPHAVPACEEYEAPPTAVVLGLGSGVLDDSRAPLVIDFGVPVDPNTVMVKVAIADTDTEGNLADEDANPESALRVVLRRDPGEGDLNVDATFEEGDRKLRLVPKAALPVGPKLVLLVEAGITSRSGRVTTYRQKILFSYTVRCAAGRPTTFQSGTYFALLDVEKPISTQIQLFGIFEADPATGALVGQFTNADRDPRLQCPTPCSAAEVCRKLPSPACVPPSERAAGVDDYPDFVPNATPPTGYSFFIQGCVVDDGDKSGVVTAPARMVVQSPNVTIEGLTLTAQFANAGGTVRGNGGLSADVVFLGESALGGGKGTMSALRIPDDRAPAGIPRPAPLSTNAPNGNDAGTEGGTR